MSLSTPKIVVVMQARNGSTRLPRKVLLDLAGKPMLVRHAERILASDYATNFVVATTTLPQDDSIEELCRENNLQNFRGHPNDLLDRHYQAALPYQPDAVVKIPCDCPLIDPAIINQVISCYLENLDLFDYVSNLHPASWPDGNDVEIFSFSALETAWREACLPMEREHTTPFFWENPQRFRIGNVKWNTGVDYSMSHRWTLDYPEDYEFIKSVYDRLYKFSPAFTTRDILALLDRAPQLASINSHLAGVNWYRHHLPELRTITSRQTRQENSGINSESA